MPFTRNLVFTEVEALDGSGKVQVRVGDWVDFKYDVEQSGQIVKITDRSYCVELTLRNEHGFSGEYIGGDTETTMHASDCWA